MGDKSKAICKWSKSQCAKQLDELREIVKDPKFICKDCGRVAREKKWLCKPTKI